MYFWFSHEKFKFDKNIQTMASVLDKELSSYLKQLNEREKKDEAMIIRIRHTSMEPRKY